MLLILFFITPKYSFQILQHSINGDLMDLQYQDFEKKNNVYVAQSVFSAFDH